MEDANKGTYSKRLLQLEFLLTLFLLEEQSYLSTTK